MPLQAISDQAVDELIAAHHVTGILSRIDVTDPETAVALGYWEVIQRLARRDQIHYYKVIYALLLPQASTWPTQDQVDTLVEITIQDSRRLALPDDKFNYFLSDLLPEKLGPVIAILSDMNITTMHQLAMTPVAVIYDAVEQALEHLTFSLKSDFFRHLTRAIQIYIEYYNELEHFIPTDVRTELNPVTE